MCYITKANSRRILKKISINSIGEVSGEVYKKPIFFFSNFEIKYLLLMQSLLKEPEKFAIEFYHPIVNKDTYSYVFESEAKPSYHMNKDCERLNSTFSNFEIPFEIKARVRDFATKEGKTESEIENIEIMEVSNFRDWFKKKIDLFTKNPEYFLKQLEIRWNVKRNIREIKIETSGFEHIENINLSELENEIDKKLTESGRFFVNNKDKQHIIRRFQKLTFLAYSKDPIKANDTELSDDELRKFLLDYDTKFKKPVKDLLIEYYRIKFNPELSFEGKLLERLNFRPCSTCCQNQISSFKIPINSLSNDDEIESLPF